MREKTKPGICGIHYARLEDTQSGTDKLRNLASLDLVTISFDTIIPDGSHNWLNQSNPDFGHLLPLTNKGASLSQDTINERDVFALSSMGVSTNRDEWVYDFEVANLRNKALCFTDVYNDLLQSDNHSFPPTIKWSSTLRSRFERGEPIIYNDGRRISAVYRPFTTKHYLAESLMSDRLTRNHYEMFGRDLRKCNRVICFQATGARRPFAALASDRLPDNHLFFDGTQCLPLYRYTPDGELLSNITEWGLRQFREHYGDKSITAEDIFAYTYAVLHDPAYRETYAVDLLREFPRLPFNKDFPTWVRLGQELLDLHIGFESVETFSLERVDKDGAAGKATLKADKAEGTIVLDGQTTLTGVPTKAWEYRLGSRSALEWVLDQYKEKKPRDSTIAARFNNYRFANHKERVIDLLQRVCTVSVETVRIISQLNLLTSIEAEDETYLTEAHPTQTPDNHRSRP